MGRPVERYHLAMHLTKLAIPLTLLLLVPHPLGRLVGATLVFLAGFALTHDLAHGALGLPPRLNDVALAAAALTNLLPGHAMRRLHARHHARPLADDDVEGEGARRSWWGALCIGPRNALRYRLEGLTGTHGAERAWVIAETALGLALAFAALESHAPAALTWLGACLFLQATMALWASHLPHRPPPLLVRLARHLTWTRSAVVASFLHHDAHHRRPWVPCGELGAP
ncbi:MAG: fatty acid desaturase [Myxococcaceae bacterium]|jgi:fatty acid desaturase|nr:fatty acid desaturase [Myxococcaceae bacterium]MCA3011433.1 fatty acid desaturase [Myxococcaceae bacterium]